MISHLWTAKETAAFVGCSVKFLNHVMDEAEFPRPVLNLKGHAGRRWDPDQVRAWVRKVSRKKG